MAILHTGMSTPRQTTHNPSMNSIIVLTFSNNAPSLPPFCCHIYSFNAVLFKIKEDAADEKAKEMMAAVAAFKNQLPELILSMHSGVDKSAQTQGFSYCKFPSSFYTSSSHYRFGFTANRLRRKW
jgi:hypothetical protein